MGFDYNSQKVRGVNLGGWFVLEPFITPSLFQAFGSNMPVDEYHYCQQLGQTEASSRLTQHWNTWITENDFKTIAGWGFNHVRIPIGYWAFQPLSGDPYVQGQEAVLDQAIQWASNNGLKVWIDLHGAPGSQNGFDNSGLRDTLQWQQGNNVANTLSVIQYLANKYAQPQYNSVVTSIELLNEPLGPDLDMNQVEQYYINGYNEIRNSGSSTAVTIHDAFMPLGYYDSFLQVPDYWNVILDHHQYQVFNVDQLQESITSHVQSACSIGQQMGVENLWRVTGEWSAAMTDCTMWLNGLGRNARYDGNFDNSPYIGSCSDVNSGINNWSSQLKQNTRMFIEAQMDAYDQGNGWIFWTYHTENSPEWDLTQLINAGLFPQPLTDRQYPGQCQF